VRVSLIAAVARNGVIGRGGKLPWHLPADLKRFKELTLGHHVIMGRRTWESIGKALPGRTNVVVSRRANLPPPGVTVVRSLDAALDAARADGDDEAFVIGGGELYAAALRRADRIYLTVVDADVEGDARFPAFDRAQWVETAREPHLVDERHAHAFAFTVLDRRATSG
jgi:dihydrofolate reductase